LLFDVRIQPPTDEPFPGRSSIKVYYGKYRHFGYLSQLVLQLYLRRPRPDRLDKRSCKKGKRDMLWKEGCSPTVKEGKSRQNKKEIVKKSR
jgi:hypothetical protein